MPRKTPDALCQKVRIFSDAAAATARWFRRPDPAALSAARTARLRARSWRSETNSDAADLSFALREAIENTVQAVSDAALWGLGADADFAAVGSSLCDGAKALVHAADASGPVRVDALVQAKRWAAEVERRCRSERAVERESTHFVESVKRADIARKLSSAAEALQQACDSLTGSFAR